MDMDELNTESLDADARPGLPLAGLRVVNTRARDQAAALTRKLAERGAEVIELPLIAIAPPIDRGPLVRAAARLDDYDWAVFTSVNGVDYFWIALRDVGLGAEAFAHIKTAAVGAATARRLRELGVEPTLVPDHYVAEALLPALKEAADLERIRFLMPRGDLARSFLPDALRDAGAAVDELIAYRTIPDESAAECMAGLFDRSGADCVTFTSSSAVESFVRSVGAVRLKALLPKTALASIGPVTSKTMRELDLPVTVEAHPHDIEGLVSALEGFFRDRAG